MEDVLRSMQIPGRIISQNLAKTLLMQEINQKPKNYSKVQIKNEAKSNTVTLALSG